MTPRIDAAAPVLQDTQNDNRIDNDGKRADATPAKVDVPAGALNRNPAKAAGSGDEITPSNVITLTEEDLAREHSRLEAKKHEDSSRSARHAAGRSEAQPGGSPIGNLAELVGVPLDGGIPEKPLHYRFIKRAFDIAFSACVIAVGFVPGLVLCAFVAKDTGGSPIYKSTRVGLGGKPFHIYKFRTMVADADDLEKHLSAEQLEQWHMEHKVDDDPRITKLGEFLRSSSIDEFPQFLNVFVGQIPSRILKTRPGAPCGSRSAFALPAYEERTKMAAFPQVESLRAESLRKPLPFMVKSTPDVAQATEIFAKPVFGAASGAISFISGSRYERLSGCVQEAAA